MFKINRKIIVIITVIFIIVGFFIFLEKKDKSIISKKHLPVLSLDKNLIKILVGEKEIKVELVWTSRERSKGLSNRKYLAPDKGMLFLYSSPGRYKFWMKDMSFPIDIIWINNSRIVEISKNVSCPSPDIPIYKLPKYSPEQPVTAVLEVNAGFADKSNIQVGDKVEIPNL